MAPDIGAQVKGADPRLLDQPVVQFAVGERALGGGGLHQDGVRGIDQRDPLVAIPAVASPARRPISRWSCHGRATHGRSRFR
jgi:hypothetical protein